VSVLLPVPGTLTDNRGEFSLAEPSQTALPAQKKSDQLVARAKDATLGGGLVASGHH
jgi:hypothetical protein